jgi:hypothetical protein
VPFKAAKEVCKFLNIQQEEFKEAVMLDVLHRLEKAFNEKD